MATDSYSLETAVGSQNLKSKSYAAKRNLNLR